MDPALVIAALQLAAKLIDAYPAIRAAATTQDKAALDAAYSGFKESSNAVADRLRATPDDPA